MLSILVQEELVKSHMICANKLETMDEEDKSSIDDKALFMIKFV